jgi:hypothetical protein
VQPAFGLILKEGMQQSIRDTKHGIAQKTPHGLEARKYGTSSVQKGAREISMILKPTINNHRLSHDAFP